MGTGVGRDEAINKGRVGCQVIAGDVHRADEVRNYIAFGVHNGDCQW